MTTHRHQLTCYRAGCGRPFSSTRSDALYCSRRCRRDKSPPVTAGVVAALPIGNGDSPAITSDKAPEVVEEEDLNGWRRVGPYLVPPADPRLTFRVGDDWFR